MKGNNAEDEDQRQNEDNNRVDLEAGALVGVETEHGAARATGTSGARAVGASIGDLLLLIGGSTATDGGTGTTGGRRRGGAARGNADSGRGSGGGGTRRRLVWRCIVSYVVTSVPIATTSRQQNMVEADEVMASWSQQHNSREGKLE